MCSVLVKTNSFWTTCLKFSETTVAVQLVSAVLVTWNMACTSYVKGASKPNAAFKWKHSTNMPAKQVLTSWSFFSNTVFNRSWSPTYSSKHQWTPFHRLLMHWISDTCLQGCTCLQILMIRMGRRGVVTQYCGHARLHITLSTFQHLACWESTLILIEPQSTLHKSCHRGGKIMCWHIYTHIFEQLRPACCPHLLSLL